MSAFPGPANPIFYSQFRIRGGWKTMLVLSGGYAVVIGGLIWFSAHASDPAGYTGALTGWLDGLLSLQVLFLFIFGSSRVSAAVRSDVTGKIIESHRLMPLSPFAAIIGYITGPPIQTISLAIVTFILGIFTAAGAGIELQRWLIANFMLAALVILIWVITAQLAFSTRGGFILIVLAIGVAVFSNGSTMVLLPALSVLTCPLIGRSVFDFRSTFTDLPFPFLCALIAQFIIGAICFTAAMRKYRLPEAVGFNALLSVLLLAAWTIISLVGIAFIDLFIPRNYYRGNSDDLRMTQFIASIITSMLLALMPLAATARANDTHRRQLEAGGDARRPVKPWIVTLAVAIIICIYVIVAPSNRMLATACLHTFAIMLAMVIAVELLFRWAYLRFTKAWLIIVTWMFLIWLAPIIVDGIYHALSETTGDGLTLISSVSPIGALILTWNQPTTPVLPGIAIQWTFILFPALLYFKADRRKSVIDLPQRRRDAEKNGMEPVI